MITKLQRFCEIRAQNCTLVNHFSISKCDAYIDISSLPKLFIFQQPHGIKHIWNGCLIIDDVHNPKCLMQIFENIITLCHYIWMTIRMNGCYICYPTPCKRSPWKNIRKLNHLAASPGPNNHLCYCTEPLLYLPNKIFHSIFR